MRGTPGVGRTAGGSRAPTRAVRRRAGGRSAGSARRGCGGPRARSRSGGCRPGRGRAGSARTRRRGGAVTGRGRRVRPAAARWPSRPARPSADRRPPGRCAGRAPPSAGAAAGPRAIVRPPAVRTAPGGNERTRRPPLRPPRRSGTHRTLPTSRAVGVAVARGLLLVQRPDHDRRRHEISFLSKSVSALGSWRIRRGSPGALPRLRRPGESVKGQACPAGPKPLRKAACAGRTGCGRPAGRRGHGTRDDVLEDGGVPYESGI